MNLAYQYESFGNMLSDSAGFNDSYTAQNQMFGYPYDAVGNQLLQIYVGSDCSGQARGQSTYNTCMDKSA
jgi:hypothetical protein